jgi:hypothetical protein
MRVVAFALVAAVAADLQSASPIDRVVELIDGLRAKIVADGEAEQTVYDKYACWCESTTARKAAAIEDAKTLIEELAKRILELKGRLGTYVAEIAKLEKDIAETTEAINKAEELRAKEHEAYIKKKGDLEHALENLIKAIDVLTAGTTFEKSEGQKAVDASMEKAGIKAAEETQLLSVAAGLRAALSSYDTVSYKSVDVAPIKSFLSNPQGALVQLHSNPALGTYNAQSGVIQGILSQMKDDFEKELKDSAAEEEEAAAQHAQLMETKRSDLALLEATLIKTKQAQGDDTQQLAEDQQERSETQKQLKEDEIFFDETKQSSSAKAALWSSRSQARTEELAAIDEAISILTSDEAKATFENSTSTFFLQLSESTEPANERTAAYNILKKAATQSHSLRLATIATTVSTTGHFDMVLRDIDVMIENLRAEEKADIEHRDWCESEKKSAEFKNENLQYDQEQLTKKIERAEGQKEELEEEVTKTQTEKNETLELMQEAKETRIKENSQFKQALRDDAEAVKLIDQALLVLSKVYGFVQVQKPPAHALKHLLTHKRVDPEDSPPETFSGEYGGRKSEGTGILSILSMIKEDIQKEMKVASEEEAESLKAYEDLRAESQATVNALDAKIVSLGQDIANKMKVIADLSAVKENKASSESATDNYLKDLGPNCEWVDKHFDSRAEKRKAEIEGLQKAKAVLAGASESLVSTKHHVDQELKELDETEQNSERSFLQRNQRH